MRGRSCRRNSFFRTARRSCTMREQVQRSGSLRMACRPSPCRKARTTSSLPPGSAPRAPPRCSCRTRSLRAPSPPRLPRSSAMTGTGRPRSSSPPRSQTCRRPNTSPPPYATLGTGDHVQVRRFGPNAGRGAISQDQYMPPSAGRVTCVTQPIAAQARCLGAQFDPAVSPSTETESGPRDRICSGATHCQRLSCGLHFDDRGSWPVVSPIRRLTVSGDACRRRWRTTRFATAGEPWLRQMQARVGTA